MIIETGMEIYRVGLCTRNATEYFFTAHDTREFSAHRSEYNRQRGIEELQKAAQLLGFDLVNIAAPEPLSLPASVTGEAA